MRLYLRWVRLRAGKTVITGVLLCNRERDKIEGEIKRNREREIMGDRKRLKKRPRYDKRNQCESCTRKMSYNSESKKKQRKSVRERDKVVYRNLKRFKKKANNNKQHNNSNNNAALTANLS